MSQSRSSRRQMKARKTKKPGPLLWSGLAICVILMVVCVVVMVTSNPFGVANLVFSNSATPPSLATPTPTSEPTPEPTLTPEEPPLEEDPLGTSFDDPNQRDVPLALESGKAYIAFTFDDGCASDYTLAYPLLSSYGIKGTSYILPDKIDTGEAKALTWAQVQELLSAGWAIGEHSYDHVDFTTLNEDKIREQMQKVNDAFEAQGLQSPSLHAEVKDSYTEKEINIVSEYRSQIRRGDGGYQINTIGDLAPYALRSVSANIKGEDDLQSLKECIDDLTRTGGVLVLRVRCLYENKSDAASWSPGTSFDLFKQLVDYTAAIEGIEFLTMQELALRTAQPPEDIE